jgi:hypothetical protein
VSSNHNEDRRETQDECKKNQRYDRSCCVQNGGFDSNGN